MRSPISQRPIHGDAAESPRDACKADRHGAATRRHPWRDRFFDLLDRGRAATDQRRLVADIENRPHPVRQCGRSVCALGARRADHLGLLAQPRGDDADRLPGARPQGVHHEQPTPRRRDRHTGAGALGHPLGARLGDPRRRRRLPAARATPSAPATTLRWSRTVRAVRATWSSAGIIHLGKATGAPIFPVTYAATRRRHLRSWDRLIIPLPFARIVFIVGEPIEVPRHASD